MRNNTPYNKNNNFDSFGFDETEIKDLLADSELDSLENVEIIGLMGMATFTDDKTQIHQEFARLKDLFEKVKNTDHAHVKINTLSMGMSGDYEIAIEEGSNMVRIGSAIFGARN